MNIVMAHYHLKSGGVTSVLRRQAAAVRNDCRLLVLSGGPPPTGFPFPTAVIPGLGYDRDCPPGLTPQDVASSILRTVRAHFGGPGDLLHFHNPTLAKNRLLTAVLKELQAAGVRLLLQIHDFSEDGRPAAYSREEYVSDCHYGVINSRDFAVLEQAGLLREGLHLLNNSVAPLKSPPVPFDRRVHVLYPVRAIRRKNIGEALLLSSYFPGGPPLAVTLPPNSPADMDSYEAWRRFSRRHRLGVLFGAGLRRRFEDLVASSRFLVTTSITEGFGFSFLEPWTADRMLWGRRLEDICRDFEARGVRLDHLYDRLAVPLKWIDRRDLHLRWKACVRANAEHYGHPVADADIKAAFEALTVDRCIDFGLLDEALQMQVIERVIRSPVDTRTLQDLNPSLQSVGRLEDEAARVAGNRRRVMTAYDPADDRQNLLEVYRRAATCPVRHRISKSTLLEAFFRLSQFSLLKWAPYAG